MQHMNVAQITDDAVVDPVCGMSTESPESYIAYDYEETTFYFCSNHCLEKFKRSPDRFLSDEIDRSDGEVPETDTKKHTSYTCPMHPEVHREGPGDCPKCGMALEPKTVAEESDDNHEYLFMRKRFWISVILSLPVMVIAMRDLFGLGFLERTFGSVTLHWAEFVLATPVVLWGGRVFYVRAWKSIASWNLNMFTLIGLGTAVAYLYSVAALIFPDLFPASFRASDGTVAVYFEASAMIITLVLLGQLLEQKARSRTGSAIKALLGLAPKTARRIEEDGSEHDVPLDEIRMDDRLRVRPGEKVPVDGTVIDGNSSVQEADISTDEL